MAATASESANQLYLETDPSNREPIAQYLLRYQLMAIDQLHAALKTVDATKQEVGDDAWMRLLREHRGFAVQLADVMLLRDNLNNSVKELELKQKENRVDCAD